MSHTNKMEIQLVRVIEIGKKIRTVFAASLAQWQYYLSMDIFIIEHPKSGRTWLRYMLDSYLEMSNIDLKIGFTHDGTEFNMLDSQALLRRKFISRLKYRYKKIIFLIREPKDVMVSLYFQATKRMGVLDSTYSISEFIRHPCFGIEKMITFLNIWQYIFNRRIVKDYIIISYEGMHENCRLQMERVLQFLDIPIYSDLLNKAIDENTFTNMKKRELQNTMHSDGSKLHHLKAVDINDPESFKVRKGIVGGYRDYLSDEDIAYINYKLKKNLKGILDDFCFLRKFDGSA